MAKIVPHLWFNDNAQEALEFYTQLFENSEIKSVQELEGTPSGENAASYVFKLAGQDFQAINGGPIFKHNPSLSFMVVMDTKEEVSSLWDSFIKDGKELLPLQKYPFSEWYGWVQDKYGLSWQVVYSEGVDYGQKITPTLFFSEKVIGQAEEAIEFYTDIFKDGKIEEVHKYKSGDAKNPQAKLSFSTFDILNTRMHALDDGDEADYTFNEAFSFIVFCATQAELDYYWNKLSAVPEAEECGWLKDKYGVSWQILPKEMNEFFTTGTREQINRTMQVFLEMKKVDIKKLEKAWLEE